VFFVAENKFEIRNKFSIFKIQMTET